MKDKEVKMEEIECRSYSPVRYTIVNRSHRIFCREGKGSEVAEFYFEQQIK
jgi:hypothetical protein